MLRFEVDAETLGALLSAVAAPRVQEIRCVREEVLVLQVDGVDVGIQILGKDLPRLGVTLAISAQAPSEVLLDVRLEVREVAGLGAAAARLLPRSLLVRKLVETISKRLRLEGGVEVREDGSLRIALDQLRSSKLPGLTRLRCERCEVPAPDGLAVAVAFRMEDPPAA